jgi:CDP-diacylglycerol pyrophosphatase
VFAVVRKLLWIVLCLIAPCLIAPCLIAVDARAGDPSVLWKITNDKCVPHMRQSNDPAPCSLVDLNAGYVILKDLIGATQFLLIPTERISGIDSPEIVAPNAPNYWDFAWRARTWTEAPPGRALPRDMLSLAINSPDARSQDQLHIHIDCVRPDVRDALAAHRGAIAAAWTEFPVIMAEQRWRAFRVDGDNLSAVNPFRLLANDDAAGADMAKPGLAKPDVAKPGLAKPDVAKPDVAKPDVAKSDVAKSDVAKHGLAVVGMTWGDGAAGFVVLDAKVDPASGGRGSAEDLQDHDCALAH